MARGDAGYDRTGEDGRVGHPRVFQTAGTLANYRKCKTRRKARLE